MDSAEASPAGAQAATREDLCHGIGSGRKPEQSNTVVVHSGILGQVRDPLAKQIHRVRSELPANPSQF